MSTLLRQEPETLGSSFENATTLVSAWRRAGSAADGVAGRRRTKCRLLSGRCGASCSGRSCWSEDAAADDGGVDGGCWAAPVSGSWSKRARRSVIVRRRMGEDVLRACLAGTRLWASANYRSCLHVVANPKDYE